MFTLDDLAGGNIPNEQPQNQPKKQQASVSLTLDSLAAGNVPQETAQVKQAPAQSGVELPQAQQPVENPGFFSKVGGFFTDTVHNVEKVGAEIGSRIVDNVKEAKFMIDDNLKHSTGVSVGRQALDDLNSYLAKSTALADKPWGEILKPGIDASPDHINLAGRIAAAARKLAYEGLDKEMTPPPDSLTPQQKIDYYTQASEHIAAKRTAASYILGGTQSALTSDIAMTGTRAALTILGGKDKADSVFKNLDIKSEEQIPQIAIDAGQVVSLVVDSMASYALLGPLMAPVSSKLMQMPKIATYLANPAASPTMKALITTWINNAPRGMAAFSSMNMLKELGDQVIAGNIDPASVAGKGLEGLVYGGAFPLGEGAAGAATSRFALMNPAVGKVAQKGAIVAGAVGVNTILSSLKALSNDGQIDSSENSQIWRSGIITGVLSILGAGSTANEINNLRSNYTGLALDQYNMRTNPYGDAPVDKNKMQSVISDLSEKADAYSRDILHEAHPVRDFSRIEDDPNPYRVLLNKVSAYTYYQKDVDYIVKDGKIVLIDQNTGRPRPELTPSHGMNSALETKEGLYEGQNTTLPMSSVLSPEEKLMLQISNDTAAAPVASGKGPQAVVRKLDRSIVTEFDKTLVQTHQVTPQAVEHFTMSGIEAGVNAIGVKHVEDNAQILHHTPEEVTTLAKSRLDDLNAKAKVETLNPTEKTEATFLQKNIANPEAVAKMYDMVITPQETTPAPNFNVEPVNVTTTETNPAQVNIEAPAVPVEANNAEVPKYPVGEPVAIRTMDGLSNGKIKSVSSDGKNYTVSVKGTSYSVTEDQIHPYANYSEGEKLRIEDLAGLKNINPKLFRQAEKATSAEDFINAVIKSDKTQIDHVNTDTLTSFYNRVKGVQPETTTIVDKEIGSDAASYIDKAEKELRSVYFEKGTAADIALKGIVAEMKYAEAGKRVIVRSPIATQDDEIFGVPSSFPEFISDELRRKNLFDKVYEGLQSIDSIHIPGKGRSRQRQLYNELLNELDRNLGVSTLPIRETINEIYDKADKGKAGNIDISGHEGALAGRAAEARKQEGPKEEVAQEVPAEVQAWAKDINPNADPIQMFGMKGEQEWNIEAKNGDVFAFPDKPIDQVKESAPAYNAKVVPFVGEQQPISMKREMPIRSSSGEKVTLAAGEVFTPHMREDGKVVLQSDNKKVLVNAATYAEIQKAANTAGVAQEFAPELKQTEETVTGISQKSERHTIAEIEAAFVEQGLSIDQEMGGEVMVTDSIGELVEDDSLLENYPDLYELAGEYYDTINGNTTVGEGETRYDKYQLPGGDNYREILIKAPIAKNHEGPLEWKAYGTATLFAEANGRTFGIMSEGPLGDEKNNKPFYVYEKDGLLGRNVDTIEHAKELAENAFKMSSDNKTGFKSSHWEERNVLAHLRLNERTYNGNKVLFMEELQSDWAREARANKDIVGNPLLKNWQELAIKRAMIEAVKSKADIFAWANGKQQQERYNLSKEIDSIGWSNDVTAGNKNVEIQPKQGTDIQLIVNEEGTVTGSVGGRFEQFTGKKLDDVIGKGLAEKIMERPSGLLSGNGLNIGGEWAINLYDKQVKSIVEFLTGAKVETFNMGIESEPLSKWHPVDNVSDHTKLITEKDLQVGKVIANDKGNYYVITSVEGGGKFWAMPNGTLAGYLDENQTFAQYLDLTAYEQRLLKKNGESQRAWIDEQVSNRKSFIFANGQEYNIGSNKSDGQQGIKLTDEIRAKIEGKALPIKAPATWAPTMLDTSIIKDGPSTYYADPAARTYEDLTSSPLKVKYKKDGYVLFPNEKISSPADIAFAFQGLKNEAVEKFIVVGAKSGQIVSVETISIGTIDASLVDPFESIDLLLKKKADSVYLVHNHPSGDITPSYEDSLVTGRLKDAYAELDITFKGHIIIDTTKYGLINEKLEQSQEFQMTDIKNPVKASAYRKYVEWSKNKPSDFLMNNPASIAQLVKGLNMDNGGSAAVVFVDTRYRVVSVQQMPQSRLTAVNIIKLAVGMRSKKIFIVNHGIEDFKLKQLRNSLSQNANIEIVDGITLHDSGALTSAQESGVIRDKGIDFYESDKPSEPLILKPRTTRQTIRQASEMGIKFADKMAEQKQARIELENKLRNFTPEKFGFGQSAKAFVTPLKVVEFETKRIYQQRSKEIAIGKERANREYREFKKKPYIGDENLKNILLYESGEPVRDSFIVNEVQKTFDKLYDEANDRLNRYNKEVQYHKNYLPQVYKEDRPAVQRALANFLLDKGIDPHIVSDYINGIQEMPEEIVRALKVNPSFMHHRVFPNYKTAMQYGLTPRYNSIARLVGHYIEQMEITVANNKFIDQLEEKGKITLLPLQGYEAINIPFSPQGYYAKPSVAHLLNGVFQDPNNAGFGARVFSFVSSIARLMQQVKLSAGIPKTSLNFFTFAISIKELTMLNPKAIPVLLRSNANKYSIDYFQEHSAAIKKLADEGVDLSGRIGNYKDIQGYSHFIDFLKTEKVNKIVGFSWNKMFEEKTFKSFLPQMYIGVYESAEERFLAAGFDPKEAQRLAAETVKASFGIIGDIGRSKLAKDVMSTFLFAPPYREGIINMLLNSVRSISTEWSNPAFYRNRRFVAGLIISYLVYDALNYQYNKRHLQDNPAGMELELMIPTPMGINIRIPLLPSILALPRAMVSGTFAAAKGDFQTAGQKFGSILSMPFQLASELITNRDFFGRPIYLNTDSGPEKLAKMAEYAGLAVNHPFITELYKQIFKQSPVTGKPWNKPIYQSISEALELPMKYITDKQLSDRAFYDERDAQKLLKVEAMKGLQGTFEKILAMRDNGNIEGANLEVSKLSDEEYALYKTYKATQKAKDTRALTVQMADMVRQTQVLKDAGNKAAADALVQDLTDAEYKAYNSAKKQMGYK